MIHKYRALSQLPKQVEVYTGFTCDRCGKTVSCDDPDHQEGLQIDFVGGYSSVFGDGVRVEADICQGLPACADPGFLPDKNSVRKGVRIMHFTSSQAIPMVAAVLAVYLLSSVAQAEMPALKTAAQAVQCQAKPAGLSTPISPEVWKYAQNYLQGRSAKAPVTLGEMIDTLSTHFAQMALEGQRSPPPRPGMSAEGESTRPAKVENKPAQDSLKPIYNAPAQQQPTFQMNFR